MAEDDTTRAGATSDDAESLGAGDTFAGLRIDGIAGRGGSGVVYRAWDTQLDQPRALKVLFPDLSRGPRFKERFERESRLIASLDHPSVVTVHRAGEHGGRLFLSMQLVDGETLADLLEREGPLSRERTVSILSQVASALDAARDQGLVHRDVKPANILVAGDRAYLTDFGIAKHTVAAEPLTEPGEMVGTANYVAPEQVSGGAVSAATDNYALACVAYECLTGVKPFERDTKLATLVAHTTDARPAATNLDERTAEVLRRGMAIDPEDRYESATELIETLADPPPDQLSPRFSRWKLALAGVAVLAVGLIAFVAVNDSGKDDESPSEPKADVVPVPPGGEIDREAKIDHPASAITVGNIKVWVAGQAGLSGIDPARGAVDPELTSGGGALNAVTVGFGSIWAVDGTGRLLRFNPSSTSEPVEIPLPDEPTDATTTLSAVWVALSDGNVVRVNGANEIDATIAVGKNPVALAADQPLVWVADLDGDSVLSIDTQTNAVQDTIEVEAPIDVTVTEETIWVLSKNGDLTGIDRITRKLDPSLSLRAPGANAIDAGFGSLWLTDAREGELERLDPSGSSEWKPVRIPDATDLATGTDSIWVATGDQARVVQVRPGS